MTVALHWLRGTSFSDPMHVLGTLARLLDESVVVLDSGGRGYSDGWLVGPVRVSAADGRPEMGVKVEITGEGCEVLGHSGLAEIASRLDLRVSRVDVAWDGGAFTPAHVRDEWMADRVRTRVKVPVDARDDRQWRTCRWLSNPAGDTFTMGARESMQHVRVYDRRGSTRVELEIKHDLAHEIGQQLVGASVDPERFADMALGLLRRFVDFVDPDTSTNRSRCTLLPWWASFVGTAAKARVDLPGRPVRSAPEMDAWIEHAVGPALAVVHAVYGSDRLQEIVDRGRERWTGRHRSALHLASAGALPGTA